MGWFGKSKKDKVDNAVKDDDHSKYFIDCVVCDKQLGQKGQHMKLQGDGSYYCERCKSMKFFGKEPLGDPSKYE